MAEVTLEHVNLTVRDAKETGARLATLFDWKIRWEGASIHGGYSVHVGGDASYLALYSPPTPPTPPTASEMAKESYFMVNGLNHIGVTVDDLDDAEKRVKEAGYKPYSHADYEPGRRFYFDDEDGVEYEVVSYV